MGPLSVPLRLQSIPIEGPSEGRRPPPTYEGKLTVLDEGRDLGDYGDFSVRVLVTGGYLHGGGDLRPQANRGTRTCFRWALNLGH